MICATAANNPTFSNKQVTNTADSSLCTVRRFWKKNVYRSRKVSHTDGHFRRMTNSIFSTLLHLSWSDENWRKVFEKKSSNFVSWIRIYISFYHCLLENGRWRAYSRTIILIVFSCNFQIMRISARSAILLLLFTLCRGIANWSTIITEW